MEQTTPDFDEKTQLNELLKSFKGSFKFINSIGNIKPGKADSIEKLEKVVKEIPAPEVLVQALEENITLLKKFIEQAKALRINNFSRYEAEYLKELKVEGKPVRESSNGWRIGKLEIKVKPDLCKVRVLYNNEVLINWTPVNSKDDFILLETKANSMLEHKAIGENDLVDIFWEAYRQAVFHRSDKSNTILVPIRDFYKEVQIALFRKMLEGKKTSTKRVKHLEFPIWAFLYNLDIYRSMGAKIPENKKISLQTGSMQETSQGKGLVVNGLTPHDEYKVMCYVVAVKGGAVG